MIQFSVIIPTFNRVDDLTRCLESLVKQQIDHTTYEVIVVNDGGAGEVEKKLKDFRLYLGDRVHYIYQEQSGPAAARNRALDRVQGEIIFILNDDVILEQGYIAAHLRAHQRQPRHAVRGNTRWHPEVITSPFMHWISQNLFFYYLIEDPMDIGYEYFHTLDLSIHRRWFDEDRFDEQFKHASLEDTELAMRLIKKGLKLQFAPDAFSYHYHHYTLSGYLEKIKITAQSARRVVDIHPELRQRLIGMYSDQTPLQLYRDYLKIIFFEGKESPLYWSYITNHIMRRYLR